MRFSYANIGRLLAGAVICGALISCGSASNNDQGVSFTLLGYFAGVPSDSSTAPQQLTGLSILLSDPNDEAAPGAGNFGGGTVLAVIGLQNNITTQFMRTDQVFFEYNIPGASAQPPTTNYPLNVTLGAGPSSSLTPPNSTLPGGFDGLANSAYAQVPIVPADVRGWMILNRDLLPATPFTLIVTTSVTGVTSAGDRLDSNNANLFVQVNDDNLIAPTVSTPVPESDDDGTP